MSHFYKILNSTFFMFFVSCSGEFQSQESLPVHLFSGIQQLELQDDDTFMLSWNSPNSKLGIVKYKIYVTILDTVPEDANYIKTIASRKIGTYTLPPLETPEYTGTLLEFINEDVTFYKLGQQLDNDTNFAFQVKAINEEGIADENTTVIIVHAKEKFEYQGCLEYRSTVNSVTLTYDFPENASKVNVYRDGEIIHSSISNAKTSFTDENLLPAKTYNYMCEVIVDGIRWPGANSIDAETVNPLSEYIGCISAKAISGNEIKLDFSIPQVADTITLRRNGQDIYSVTPSQVVENENDYVDGSYPTSYVDRNLKEGIEYSYQCVAVLGDLEVRGDNKFTASTVNSNAPTFNGIRKVDILSANEVQVHWSIPSGVPSATFQIFYSQGHAIDFAVPSKIVAVGKISMNIPNLGDEIDYSFAVRACSNSGHCDVNKKIITVTMPDGGAPKTKSIEKIGRHENLISAFTTWDHTQGAIKFRRIFRMTGLTASSNFSDYSDYGESGIEFEVTNTLEPPTILQLGDIQEDNTYHFILRDYDAQGNSDNNMNVFTYTPDDLTAPAWPQGISKIENPSDQALKESSLTVKFYGVPHESNNSLEGATTYLVYYLELTPEEAASNLKDSCTNGLLYKEFSVDDYPAGELSQYTLTGLKSKTYYSVCMKAKDLAGNVSNTRVRRIGLVYDLTPPLFSGIQSISIQNKKIRISWNTSPSADTNKYNILFWSNNVNPSPISAPPVYSYEGVNYFDLDPKDYTQLQNGGSIYAIVNACDDFGQYLNGNENCTTYNLTNYITLVDIPDLVPPLDFNGIQSVSRGTSDGELVIHWTPPLDRSDYAGYAIHSVSQGHLSDHPIKTCVCESNGDCQNNNLTSCSIFVEAGKPLILAVLAFDQNNNVSPFDVNKTSALIYSPDFTTPQFIDDSSHISANFLQEERAIDITFNKATDNQYSKEPVAIAYNIYRKSLVNTPCSSESLSIADIPIDPVLKLVSYEPDLENTDDTYTFRDKIDLESNRTYLYRIEAVDQQYIPVEYLNGSNVNSKVATTYACIQAGDMEKPLFTGGGNLCPEFNESGGCANINRTDGLADAKTWTVNWDMIDPGDYSTSKENISTKVYMRVSESEEIPDFGENLSKINDVFPTMVQSIDGVTQFPVAGTTSGPEDVNIWVHYLVVISDKKADGSLGNKNWTTVSIYSENKIEITKITRSQGTSAGGKLVVIHGAGFTDDSKIYFKNIAVENECINPEMVKIADFENPRKPIKKIICTTPSWTIESGDSESVRLYLEINNKTYISPLDITYTFYNYNGLDTPDYICDNPTYPNSWLYTHAAGSADDPHIICSPDQFKSVYGIGLASANYEIGDNLNFTDSPITQEPVLRGLFDGKDYFFYNATIQQTDTYSYSFANLKGPVVLKNLSLVSFQVDMTGKQKVKFCSLLSGYSSNGGDNYEIELTNINLSGSAKCNARDSGLLAASLGGAKLSNIAVLGNIESTASDYGSQTASTAGVVARGNIAKKFLQNIVYYGDVKGVYGSVGGIMGDLQYTHYFNIKVDANVTLTGGTQLNKGAGLLGGSLDGPLTTDDNIDAQLYIDTVEAYGSVNAPNSEEIGCLVGYNGGAVQVNNVSCTGTVTGKEQVGGLFGSISAGIYSGPSWRTVNITNSTFNGVLNGDKYIGGFIGQLKVLDPTYHSWTTNISNSLFNGKIYATTGYAGGFIGAMGSYGDASASYGQMMGLNLDKLVSKGVIHGDIGVGGILGGVEFTSLTADNEERSIEISEVYVGGEIEAVQSIAGGIIGENIGSITNIKESYVDSKIISNSMVGGIIGRISTPLESMTYKPSIQSSYSAAIFDEDFKNSKYDITGGLIGKLEGTTIISEVNMITNSYYNYELSLNKQTTGEDSLPGTSKLTSEFADPNNFPDWKAYIWEWKNGYPHLKSITELKNSAK